MLHLRRAGLDDIEGLAAIRTPGDPGGAAPDRMRKYLAGEHSPQQALPPRVIWLATHEGQPVGYIAGHLTRRFGCDGELQWIYVAPHTRRMGAGSLLLEVLARWFVEQEALRICVDIGSEEARSFYRRHGAHTLNAHWMVWPNIGHLLENGAR